MLLHTQNAGVIWLFRYVDGPRGSTRQDSFDPSNSLAQMGGAFRRLVKSTFHLIDNVPTLKNNQSKNNH